MSDGKRADIWFAMYSERFLWGTLKAELEVEERAVWVDFLCLAAMFSGRVDITYTEKLAAMLIVPHELLEKSIKKFEKTKRIKIIAKKRESKTYAEISKWDLYQPKFLGGKHKINTEFSESHFSSRGKDTTRNLPLQDKTRQDKTGEGEARARGVGSSEGKQISFKIQEKIVELEMDLTNFKKKLEKPSIGGHPKEHWEGKIKETKEELRKLAKIRKKHEF